MTVSDPIVPHSIEDPRHAGFSTELRTTPALGALALLVVVSVAAWVMPLNALLLSGFAVSLLTLALMLWQPVAAKWMLLTGLTALIAVLHTTHPVPGVLTLFVVPVVLGAAMLGLRVAAFIALAVSVLLLSPTTGSPQPAEVAIALVAIWTTLGALLAIYHPVYNFVHWATDYYQRTRTQLKDALNTAVSLDEAMRELAHASRQIGLSNERLASLRLLAEEAERTKVAFVSKVSHELRTPLNMIIGLVDLMVKSPDIYGQPFPAAAFEDLQVVYRNCEHLSSLINDVLDLTQTESGRMTLHKERVDMAAVVHEALGVVQPLLTKKSLRVRLSIPLDLPRVYCDRTRIRQVILNLLSNAARFTDAGGIQVCVEQKADYIVVNVADTGPGIAPQDRERIFVPFCQGSQSLWLDKGGSGLGLSISKQFVELHGGRIWFDSRLGEGTTFSFDLPISQPVAAVAAPNRWIAEDWAWMELKPSGKLPDLRPRPRLVVCDPTCEITTSISRHSDEIDLVEVSSPAEAAQEAQRLPATVVIVNAADSQEASQLAEQVKSSAPNTPVVGCAIPSSRRPAWEAHALDYLIKPVTRDRLEQALARVSSTIGGDIRHILVVDDNPDVLRLLSRMLLVNDTGVKLRTVASGVEALQALRQQPPDLMLLDVILPDMDGWALLSAKNADAAIRDIPVIFVSAQDPSTEPLTSPSLVLTLDRGISPTKLVRCSLALSATLLQPDRAPVLAPE